MNRLFAICLLGLSLVALADDKGWYPMTLPSGQAGYFIPCNDSIDSNACHAQAEKLCAFGYQTVNRDANKGMLVECKKGSQLQPGIDSEKKVEGQKIGSGLVITALIVFIVMGGVLAVTTNLK